MIMLIMLVIKIFVCFCFLFFLRKFLFIVSEFYNIWKIKKKWRLKNVKKVEFYRLFINNLKKSILIKKIKIKFDKSPIYNKIVIYFFDLNKSIFFYFCYNLLLRQKRYFCVEYIMFYKAYIIYWLIIFLLFLFLGYVLFYVIFKTEV